MNRVNRHHKVPVKKLLYVKYFTLYYIFLLALWDVESIELTF